MEKQLEKIAFELKQMNKKMESLIALMTSARTKLIEETIKNQQIGSSGPFNMEDAPKQSEK